MPREVAALVRDQQDAELANSLVGECEINNASAVMQHLINDFGSHLLGWNAKKPIAVEGLLVNEYSHPALAEVLESFINTGNGHEDT